MEWPQLLAPWITPELVLDNWRERIDRVAAEESAYVAGLPYVKGVAIIGSVGRGTHWPISDVDLLVAADCWDGQDPEGLIQAEEKQRNQKLHAAGVPNDLEAGNWVVQPHELASAVTADDDAFFCKLDHPHWVGIVIKAPGARVVRDFDGQVRQLLDRCESVLFGDRFVHLWLRRATDDVSRKLASAAALMRAGDWSCASLDVLVAADWMTGAMYALWRKLPQSISRGASRLLAAAREAGDQDLGELFLVAARLDEDAVRGRFAAVPPAGRRERDVWLAIRQGAGEDVDALAATRDLLYVSWRVLHVSGDRHSADPYPEWTGVTNHEATVRTQLEAAAEILRRLQSAKTQLVGNWS